MEKINIAEVLIDCPKGTKLYSPIFGDVYLEKIRPHLAVVVTTESNDKEEFLYDGRYGINGECCIFPSKENRDWSKFKRQFKNGDIIYVESKSDSTGLISIYKKEDSLLFYDYCAVSLDGKSFYLDSIYGLIQKDNIAISRLTTSEEEQILFDAIKKNGYKWNPESKILEKLTKPEFKVGDEIVKRNSISNSYIVYSVSSEYYGLKLPNGSGIGVLPIEEQDEWELVPNKFDINTLKPFESKVLVRTANRKWVAAFYSHYDTDSSLHYCVVGGLWYEQCIPYNGNEHLLNTTDDCDNYFKTW